MPTLADSLFSPAAPVSGSALRVADQDAAGGGLAGDGAGAGGGFAGVLGRMQAQASDVSGASGASGARDSVGPAAGSGAAAASDEGSITALGRQEVAASFALQWAMLTRSGGGVAGVVGLGGSMEAASAAAVGAEPEAAAQGVPTDQLAGGLGAAQAATTDPVPPVVALLLGPQLSVLTTPAASATADGAAGDGSTDDLMAFARQQGFDSHALRLIFGTGGGGEGSKAVPVQGSAVHPGNAGQWMALRTAEQAAAEPGEHHAVGEGDKALAAEGEGPAVAGLASASFSGWSDKLGASAAPAQPAGSAGQSLVSTAMGSVPGLVSGQAGLGAPGRSASTPAADAVGAADVLSSLGLASRPLAASKTATPPGINNSATGQAAAAPVATGMPQPPASLAAALAAVHSDRAGFGVDPSGKTSATAASVGFDRVGSPSIGSGPSGAGANGAGLMVGAQWVRAVAALEAMDPVAESGLPGGSVAADGASMSAPAPGSATLQGASGGMGVSATAEPTAATLRAGDSVARQEIGPLDLRAQQDEDRQALTHRLGEAVAGRLLAQIERGQWQLRLSVTPHELGPVDIDLRVQGQRVEAQFQVANAHTQSLIQDSVPRLREAVGSSGMDLASVWVSAGGGDRNRGNPTLAQPDDAALAGAAGSTGDDETAAVSGVQGLDRSRSSWTPDQGALDILI